MGRPHAVYRVNEVQRNLRALGESGLSVFAYARVAKIPRTTVFGWRKKLPEGTFKGKRKPIYQNIEIKVFTEVVRMRNLGLPVRNTDVRSLAVHFAKELNIKSFTASNGWVFRLKKRYRLVYRAITKVGRKTKQTAEDELEEHRFMERIEEIVTLENTHPSRIINFDQTSVLLQNTYGKTLSPIGEKQVTVVQPPGEKERFTVGLAVTGDGQKYPAAIVFKGGVKSGKLSDSILAKLEIPDNVIVYSTRTAWWNSRLDLEWIDEMFDGKNSEFLVLIRDHFPGHLKFESDELLESRNVQQVFIPKGLTGKYQPLDVGINAPFKTLMKSAYHEWRKDRTEVTGTGYLKKPSRQDFINFVSEAWSKITAETIENAFVGAQILPEPTYSLASQEFPKDNPEDILNFSFSSIEENIDEEAADDSSLEYSFTSDC